MIIEYNHILYLYTTYIKKQIPYIYILHKIPTAYPKSINIYNICWHTILKHTAYLHKNINISCTIKNIVSYIQTYYTIKSNTILCQIEEVNSITHYKWTYNSIRYNKIQYYWILHYSTLHYYNNYKCSISSPFSPSSFYPRKFSINATIRSSKCCTNPDSEVEVYSVFGLK